MKFLGLILSWIIIFWHYFYPNILTWCLIGFFVGYGSVTLTKDISELIGIDE